MIDAVFSLPKPITAALADLNDPHIHAATCLLTEFAQGESGWLPAVPDVPAVHTDNRTPFDLAATVVKEVPSPRLRRLAMLTLLTDDPADPTRSTRGLATIVAAANDPRPDVVRDALNELVPRYIGTPIRPPEGKVFISGFPYDVLKLAEKTAQWSDSATRVDAIRRLGKSPARVAQAWETLRDLFTDPDPAVRTEVLNATRPHALKEVQDAGSKPPPQATLIVYSE